MGKDDVKESLKTGRKKGTYHCTGGKEAKEISPLVTLGGDICGKVGFLFVSQWKEST